MLYKETEIADLRGFGLSFLARAMNLVRTLLQESLTPMSCDNNWPCQFFAWHTNGAMMPFTKVKVKGKVDVSVLPLPLLSNDIFRFTFS